MPNPKRPRDPNQLAKLVTEIATGKKADDAVKEAAAAPTHVSDAERRRKDRAPDD
jgi:hypothetical protein